MIMIVYIFLITFDYRRVKMICRIADSPFSSHTMRRLYGELESRFRQLSKRFIYNMLT